MLLDPKGKFRLRVSSRDWSNCSSCRSSQAGLMLPCRDHVSASQSLYPRGLCSIQTPLHQPATAPLPQKHHGLSEKLRIGFHQSCTWVHNSCSVKYPFGRLVGWQWTETSSPKLLKISFVFSSPTYPSIFPPFLAEAYRLQIFRT